MKVKEIKQRKGFRDVFNLHMIKEAKLITDLELPYISKYSGPAPTSLLNYVQKTNKPEKFFVHFYLYDYYFDNSNSIWHGISKDDSRKATFLDRLKKYNGVITPDYSIYKDMPLIMQLWNIYRTRAMYVWLVSNNLNVILNVRWGDYRTYKYAFSGIEKHSTLSVGSHGLIQDRDDRHDFMNGFKEMIRRLEPDCLVIYGPVTSDMKNVCDSYGVKILPFECEIKSAHSGVQ